MRWSPVPTKGGGGGGGSPVPSAPPFHPTLTVCVETVWAERPGPLGPRSWAERSTVWAAPLNPLSPLSRSSSPHVRNVAVRHCGLGTQAAPRRLGRRPSPSLTARRLGRPAARVGGRGPGRWAGSRRGGVRVCRCARLGAGVCARMRVCARGRVCACARVRACACVRACAYARVRVWVHARACVRACVRVCSLKTGAVVCACARACVRV